METGKFGKKIYELVLNSIWMFKILGKFKENVIYHDMDMECIKI